MLRMKKKEKSFSDTSWRVSDLRSLLMVECVFDDWEANGNFFGYLHWIRSSNIAKHLANHHHQLKSQVFFHVQFKSSLFSHLNCSSCTMFDICSRQTLISSKVATNRRRSYLQECQKIVNCFFHLNSLAISFILL